MASWPRPENLGRTVGATGKPAGYAGGLDCKRALLEIEHVGQGRDIQEIGLDDGVTALRQLGLITNA
jgi:hypothetical protein